MKIPTEITSSTKSSKKDMTTLMFSGLPPKKYTDATFPFTIVELKKSPNMEEELISSPMKFLFPVKSQKITSRRRKFFTMSKIQSRTFTITWIMCSKRLSKPILKLQSYKFTVNYLVVHGLPTILILIIPQKI